MNHIFKRSKKYIKPPGNVGTIILLTLIILAIIFIVFYMLIKNPAH